MLQLKLFDYGSEKFISLKTINHNQSFFSVDTLNYSQHNAFMWKIYEGNFHFTVMECFLI